MSDPTSLKNALPARVGDDDGRNSVSGAQKFEGEDLLAGERRKVQLAQQAGTAMANLHCNTFSLLPFSCSYVLEHLRGDS